MVSGAYFLRTRTGDGPAVVIGWIFLIGGSTFILIGWTYAIAMFFAGRCLQSHRRPTFCFVIAVLSCLHAPIGTVLGVFTIIVLQRPSVKELFAGDTTVEPDDYGNVQIRSVGERR